MDAASVGYAIVIDRFEGVSHDALACSTVVSVDCMKVRETRMQTSLSSKILLEVFNELEIQAVDSAAIGAENLSKASILLGVKIHVLVDWTAL